MAVDNAEMNEDWTKTRSWDLYLGCKPVDTLKELLYIFGLQDSPLEVQQAKIRHFTELPSYLPAPQNLKDEIAIFVGGEILKGDVEGHDFHGNQHTGGIDGGGSDSNSGGEARQSDPGRNQVSPDRYKTAADYLQSLRDKPDGSSETSASTSKFIGESAADFTNAGGKTYEVKANMGYHDSEALYKLGKEVDEEAKRQGFKSLERYDAPDKKTEPEKYQKWAGLFMMSAALNNSIIRDNEDDYKGAVRVFIARDAEGRIAGAAQIQNNSYIHYIGSNNEVDGAGTALISNIIRNSAENGVGVAFEPLPSAIPFWEKAGFKPKTEGSDTYVLRSADAKQVAEQLKAMKVQKGDLPGHDFRGNQYSDVQASGDGWVLVPRGGKGGDAPKPREPKAAKPVIQPTVAVKPSAAARALEPPKPPDVGSPQKIEPRGGFVALTSTDIVKNLGDKEALGGVQNKGFQRVLLADGTIGTLKTGVDEDDVRREMVAVTVAKALDLPTVESVPIKEGLGKYSLLMPWIEQDPDTVPREIRATSWREARDKLRDVNPTEFDRAELLHAITGNPDDHLGNYMTTKDPVTDEIHIIPIDNAIRGGAYSFETRDAVEKLGLSTAEIQRMDAGIDSILQTRAWWCGQEAQRDLMEIHDTWKSILPDMLATASQR